MAPSSSIFKKNILALKTHRPELAKILTQPICRNHVRIGRAANGMGRLFVTAGTGEAVALHDPTDPLGVAQGTAEQMTDNLKGVTVIFGMELGYLTKALASRLRLGSALVVYEADPAIFLTALRETSMVDVLSSPFVRFVVGAGINLEDVCSQAIVDTNGPLKVVSYEPAIQLAPEAYGKKAQARLTKLPSIIAATQNAIRWRGPLYLKSILESIPHIMSAPGIHCLKGVYSNRPAVLVAAGPSLEKNVWELQKANGKTVIIAADTALGYLLARNIHPDFVVSADPQDETYRKFEGLEIPDQVALVFHPAANHQIVAHFPGPKFTMDTTIPAYQWLQSFWEPKGRLEQETMCQVHIGFNLAEWMGCSTIILVGQDLCFSEAGMHVKGGSYLSSREETDVVQRSHQAADMYGQPVRTTPTFLNYKAILEKKIAMFGGKTINATEGGLRIEGAEPSRLAETLEQISDGHDKAGCLAMHTIPGPESLPNDEGILQEIRQRTRDLFRVGRTAGHICRLLERMAAKRRRSYRIDQEMKQLGNTVQRLTGLIPRYTHARTLLHWMDISLERKLKDDVEEIAGLKEPQEKYAKQIEQGLHYYGGLSRLAPVLRNQLFCLHERMSRCAWLEKHADDALPEMSFLDRAEAYFEVARYDRASHYFTQWLEGKQFEPRTVREAYLGMAIPLALHQIRLAYDRMQMIHGQWMHHEDLAALAADVKTQWSKWQEKVNTSRICTKNLSSHLIPRHIPANSSLIHEEDFSAV